MKGGKVLVVEDETDLRNVYSIILEHAGYEVFLARNGQEGLKELKKANPQLVLLDIFMPVMDGKDFLEKLKTSKTDLPKIIVCSNTSDQKILKSMIELGADKVVTKSSLSPSDLTKLVGSYF
ncbi:MAG TPA: response regulator [Candidatus Saccharimonadales bacterium]|nr:response regulator [Candidatus Saccharimonadales bacterium]